MSTNEVGTLKLPIQLAGNMIEKSPIKLESNRELSFNFSNKNQNLNDPEICTPNTLNRLTTGSENLLLKNEIPTSFGFQTHDSIDEILNEEDYNLRDEHVYSKVHFVLKSNKTKDAILFNGYYYNYSRPTKTTTVFKCRRKQCINEDKECSSTFTLNIDGSFVIKDHQCEQLLPIQCDIMIIDNEIKNQLLINPNQSIKRLYDQKEIELVLKYDAKQVAQYWPLFEKKDSAYFKQKNKLMPKLPTSIKDLPDKYKVTLNNIMFLASPIDCFDKFISFISLIGLNVLSTTTKWYCDGTFKSSPNYFYQHFIIHAYYKSWPIPGMFSLLSDKSYLIYDEMLNNLKDEAEKAKLKLNPLIISCDFEKGAIKAFKRHFPSAKIVGCHFHFSNAIYSKLCEIGLKTLYSGPQMNKKFNQWVKLCMAFPFLKEEEVDETWEFMQSEELPKFDDLDKLKFNKFVSYLDDTWFKKDSMFKKSTWNLHEDLTTRTNNISETFNHKLNNQVSIKNSSIYKIIDIIQKEEMLAQTNYERGNEGQKKPKPNKELLKSAKIENLKLRYRFNELETMDYLIEISQYLKNYDD